MEIEIIPFEARYHAEFKSMNLEWLVQYNLLEKADMIVLDSPTEQIVEAGGVIYLARHQQQIVGSAAIIHGHDGTYELAKMAVHKDFRGMGISKLLIEKCISQAREWNVPKLILFSNHQLKTAIALYEKYGFKHIPMEDSPFLTADVKMELVL